MKRKITTLLSLCLISLMACHRDHLNPSTSTTTDTTTTTPTPSTLKIDFVAFEYYSSDSIPNPKEEIIINEPGGKILLDTVIGPFTRINTSLVTKDTLVDVTSIYYNAYETEYLATTYRAVNPTNWSWEHDQNPPWFWFDNQNVTGTNTLTYINMPDYLGFLFSQNTSTPPTYSTGTNEITLSYPYVQGNYAYMLLRTPTQYLYNLHLPTKAADTVDLSSMDTAVVVNYNPPAKYTFIQGYLRGYTDSNNLNTALLLYDPFYTDLGNTARLVYPPKYIQKYQLYTDFLTAAGSGTDESFVTYNLGNSIPTSLPFPASNAYIINSNQNSNFSINWNGTKPSVYSTTWKGGNLAWTIYTSPDSTALNPIGIFTALKSKLLPGQNLSSLMLASFGYTTIPGYNHVDYFRLACDSTLIYQNVLTSYSAYNINY